MGVNQTRDPLSITEFMDFPTIVIGGGIAGITAAVELAGCGRPVVLVEKEPYLGGKVSRFNNYFPKLCPPACGLEINYRSLRTNPLITYYTGAEVIKVCGSDGRFSVSIRLSPRLIDNRCTACGRCAEVCPENAAYIPPGNAFPMKYCIDPQTCLKEECAKCTEVCDYDAIHLDAMEAEIEIQAGRVILATGWTLYDAALLEEYHYTELPDVVSNLEFEEMLAACTTGGKELVRPSDGKKPEKIAFVQCAGSRDLKHLPYCSAVCCPASVKQALTLSGEPFRISSEIFYIDLRLSGRNEKLLNRAEIADKISLTKGKAGRIRAGEDGPVLEVEDIDSGKKRLAGFDMVVLAMGIRAGGLSGKLKKNKAGFFLDEQDKGISVAGCCKRPMEVSSTVRDATAAVLKSMRS